ncbi:MAG: metal-binding protein [Planctomycetes bacterium]|nr:metal-binding protein [Planctomycetota bacterium]
MNSDCNCDKMPSVFYYENAGKNFYKHLEKVESSGWFELYKCKKSCQYWRIDVWDKLQERFVVRIEDVKNWEGFDVTPLIKELIIKNRGGATNQDCVWTGCKNKRVEGVAYCIDHLYEGGARR